MNAKKLSLTLSALVLGLTSCGGNSGLTRKEAYTKLDEIVAATPTTQTKLTSTNNTMKDVTNADGATTKAGTLSTYVFDATTNYAHVTLGAGKTIALSSEADAETITLGANDELFAYKSGEDYVFGVKSAYADEETGNNATTSYKVTVTSKDTVSYAAAKDIMTDFAQNQIDAFVKCGREHWHNGAGGLSAYLKRQDTLDTKQKAIAVGGETIMAGATDNGSYIALADEKYSSTGAGNLTLDFDALYPNPKQPAKLHEPLKFEFNDNILTHWYNAKASNYAGNEWTMNYGTANNTVCDYAEADNAAAGAALVVTVPALITALVATDQPTATSDLYPAHWGE